jgi:hypothetical protein
VNRFFDRYPRDRRVGIRHRLRAPLRFRIRNSSVSEQKAEIENLSESGVFFATESAMPVGIAVDLLLRMPFEITGKNTADWLCTGHVVRVVPSASPGQNSRVGVAFDFYEIGGV